MRSRVRKNKFQVIEMIIFLFLSLVSFVGAYFAHHFIFSGDIQIFEDYSLLFIILTTVICSGFTLLLDSLLKSSIIRCGYFKSIGKSFVSIFVVNVVAHFLSFYLYKDAALLLLFELVIMLILLTIARLTLSKVYYSKKRNVAIVGLEKEVEWLSKKFLIENAKDRNLLYLLFEEDGELNPNIFLRLDEVDDVYLTPNLSEKSKSLIIMYCTAKKDIDVHIVPQIYEIGIINSTSNQVDDVMTLEVSSFHLTFGQRFLKRAFDIFCSVVGLLVFWPVMLIVALGIKLQDGGSPIYKQERITKGNKTFMLYKFRTMIIDAEKNTGAVLASSNDNRITKFGKFIRMTRLDELPQLWNVLKGEMSFIGPRPERKIFVDEFLKKTPSYRYRMNVKAGIAGLAQACGNYDTDYRDKLRWDLLYIKKYSIGLDIKIIFLTLKAVFDKDSSRGVSKDLPLVEFFNKFDKHFEKVDGGLLVVETKEETIKI